MLSRSVTCYVLQRNTASIMNIGFNYVFVSACKVNLSAQLLRCYGQKLFIKGRWHAATEKVRKWYAESKRLGTPDLKSKSETTFKTYKTYRNKLTHLKELSKSNYNQFRLKESGGMSDSWKTINNILRKLSKTSTLPSYVKYEGKHIYGHEAICNAMNNHFCSIDLKLSKTSTNSSNHKQSNKKFFDQRVFSSVFLEPTDEYKNIIDNLNAIKPPGSVNIPTGLIKDSKIIISPHLTRIINASLTSGKYPDLLKVAKVTPFHKGGSKCDLTNYRPISILSRFNKIHETVIKSRFIKYWNKFNVFSPTQFGFRQIIQRL